MSDYWNETVRRVGPESQEETFLEVGPTSIGSVGVYTTNEQSEGFFGRLSLEWDPKLARRVAEAILSCCDEMERL